MALSARLRHVDITFECRRCRLPITKTGAWVIAISTFKCTKCKSELHFGYRDKVELFAKYAHLT